MNQAAFYARCWENRRLLSVMLELTYACDLQCGFCYNEKEMGGGRLTLEDYRRILGQAREEGALFLTLTGGEPTLHPEFFAIGAFANDLGYSVRVKSNGNRFTEAFVRRLNAEVRPFNVDLSIHGAIAATHDAVTGSGGSFDRLMESVRLLQMEGIRIRFKLPLTRHNEGELERLFELAQSLGIKLDVVPEMTPKDSGDLSPTGLMASPAALRKLYRLLQGGRGAGEEAFGSEEDSDRMSRAIDTPFACGAGLSHLMVDPSGTAYGCVAWRDSLGDLKKQGVKEVWLGEKALRLAEQNREAGGRKRLNPALEGEMFCPGRAFIQYGNPLTIYPDSVRLATFHLEAKKSNPKE